jgi:hypothetical protein
MRGVILSNKKANFSGGIQKGKGFLFPGLNKCIPLFYTEICAQSGLLSDSIRLRCTNLTGNNLYGQKGSSKRVDYILSHLMLCTLNIIHDKLCRSYFHPFLLKGYK